MMVGKTLIKVAQFDISLIGVVPPSPACERALRMTVEALEKSGHEVVAL